MSTKKILYLTWNMELENPDDKCLKQISQRIDGIDPDLIVIGLQEAATYSKGKSRFIASKLRDKQYLGDKYRKLAKSAHFSGITKREQLFSGYAHQALQVMIRVGDKKTTARTKGYRKANFSEKGYCLASIDFYGKKLCCVSTHLEVKESKRAKDLKLINKGLNKDENKVYDSFVFMGDLNYRLNEENVTESKLKTELTTVNGRKDMMKHDSFSAAHFSEGHFKSLTWPPFDDNASLPTYKRVKVAEGSAYRSAVESLVPDQNGAVKQSDLEKAYFPLKTKETFWDLGWLDRIAYSFTKDTDLSLIGAPKMHVWSDIPYGDHTPVALLMEVDGFD